MRDRKCTFPGCTNRTPDNDTDNDTDHLTAWKHCGTTGTSNLAQLCPRHHRLKHNSQWTPDPAARNEPPGWTSPTGRHYKPEHPDPQPTHWPPGILPADAVAAVAEVRAQLNARTSVDSAGLEDGPPWHQLLAGMPAWPDPPEPPLEEPYGDNVLDQDGLCAADPLWDDFYAKPFILPPDPQADWELLLSLM